MFKQLVMATVIVTEVMEKSAELDTPTFYSMIAMMVEEKCKQEGENVIDRMETLLEASKEVVAEYGTY